MNEPTQDLSDERIAELKLRITEWAGNGSFWSGIVTALVELQRRRAEAKAADESVDCLTVVIEPAEDAKGETWEQWWDGYSTKFAPSCLRGVDAEAAWDHQQARIDSLKAANAELEQRIREIAIAEQAKEMERVVEKLRVERDQSDRLAAEVRRLTEELKKWERTADLAMNLKP